MHVAGTSGYRGKLGAQELCGLGAPVTRPGGGALYKIGISQLNYNIPRMQNKER